MHLLLDVEHLLFIDFSKFSESHLGKTQLTQLNINQVCRYRHLTLVGYSRLYCHSIGL